MDDTGPRKGAVRVWAVSIARSPGRQVDVAGAAERAASRTPSAWLSRAAWIVPPSSPISLRRPGSYMPRPAPQPGRAVRRLEVSAWSAARRGDRRAPSRSACCGPSSRPAMRRPPARGVTSSTDPTRHRLAPRDEAARSAKSARRRFSRSAWARQRRRAGAVGQADRDRMIRVEHVALDALPGQRLQVDGGRLRRDSPPSPK